jgi:hypothetical protein
MPKRILGIQCVSEYYVNVIIHNISIYVIMDPDT